MPEEKKSSKKQFDLEKNKIFKKQEQELKESINELQKRQSKLGSVFNIPKEKVFAIERILADKEKPDIKRISKTSQIQEKIIEHFHKALELMKLPYLDESTSDVLVKKGINLKTLWKETPENLAKILKQEKEKGTAVSKEIIEKENLKKVIDAAKKANPQSVLFNDALNKLNISDSIKNSLKKTQIESFSRLREIGLLESHPDTKSISKEIAANLESHARLNLVSHNIEVNEDLINDNFDCISKVAKASANQIVKASKNKLSINQAEELKKTAKLKNNYINNLYTDLITRNTPQNRGWSKLYPEPDAEQIPKIKMLISNNMLPGEEECPVCEPESSVFSPSFYLLDLINFLADCFDVSLQNAENRFCRQIGALICAPEKPVRQIELAINVLESFILKKRNQTYNEARVDALWEEFKNLSSVDAEPNVIIRLFNSYVQEIGTLREDVLKAEAENNLSSLAQELFLDVGDLQHFILDPDNIRKRHIESSHSYALEVILRKSFHRKYKKSVYEEYKEILKNEKIEMLNKELLSLKASIINQEIESANLDPADSDYDAELAEVEKSAREKAEKDVLPLRELIKQEKLSDLLEDGMAPSAAEIQAETYADTTYSQIENNLPATLSEQEKQEQLRTTEFDKYLNTILEQELSEIEELIQEDARNRADIEIEKAFEKACSGYLLKIRQNLIIIALSLSNLADSIVDTDSLADYLHIDLTVDECYRTTPTAQAIQSIQSYVLYIQMGKETPGRNDFDKQRWMWMKTYGIWHAAQMVYFYPENFLLPKLRKSSTAYFENTTDEEVENDQEYVDKVCLYITDIVNTAKIHVIGTAKKNGLTYVFGIEYYSDETQYAWNKQILYADEDDEEGYDFNHKKTFYFGTINQDDYWSGWQLIEGFEGEDLSLDWKVFNFNNKIYFYNLKSFAYEFDFSTYYSNIATFLTFNEKEKSIKKIKELFPIASEEPFSVLSLSTLDISHILSEPVFILAVAYKDTNNGKRLSYYTIDKNFVTQDIGSYIFNTEDDILSAALLGIQDNQYLNALVCFVGSYKLLKINIYNDSDAGELPGNIQIPHQKFLHTIALSDDHTLIIGTNPSHLGNANSNHLQFAVYNLQNNSVIYSAQSLSSNMERMDHYDLAFRHHINYDFLTSVTYIHDVIALFSAHGRRYLLQVEIEPNIRWQDWKFPQNITWFDPSQVDRISNSYDFESLSVWYHSQEEIGESFQEQSIPAIFYDEIFLYLPLFIFNELCEKEKYEKALEWLRLIFDPYRETIDQRLIYKRFELDNQSNDPSSRIQDPFDPYKIAHNRKSVILRHVIFKYAETLLDCADREYAQDTGESRNRARELYEMARDVLSLDEAPRDYCRQDWNQFVLEVTARFNPVQRRIFQRELRSIRNTRSRTKNIEFVTDLKKSLSQCTIGKDYKKVLSANIITAKKKIPKKPALSSLVHSQENPARQLLETLTLSIDSGYNLPIKDATPFKNRFINNSSGPFGNGFGNRFTEDLTDPFDIRVIEIPFVELIPIYIQYQFCIPTNPLLILLRYRIESNLEKLRTCRNFAGMKQRFQPYSTPVDPEQVLETLAGGGSLEDLDTLMLNTPVPIYRYSYLLEQAKSMVSQAMHIESQFLSVEEKYWQAEYETMNAKQDLAVTKSHIALQALRLKESLDSMQLASLQFDRVIAQRDHYQKLIGTGLSGWEIAALATLAAVAAAQGIAATAFAVLDASGAAQLGIQALATTSSILSTKASFERRMEEWKFQMDIAMHDMNISQQGIKIAQDHYNIIDKEKEIAELSNQHAKDTLQFLENKRFTNRELYKWLSKELKKVYRNQLYIALGMAQMAQKALCFERQTTIAFVKHNYWQGERKGLLGAEKLLIDINKLEEFRMTTETRKKELSKTMSLASLAPSEFQGFRETGVMEFNPQMQWFDREFPGHYMRLIKRVSISVMALIPPHEQIRATLWDNGCSHVMVGPPWEDTKTIYRQAESIAISFAQKATGLFEASLHDPILLPFEGKGVDSSFTLEMPKGANKFDYNSMIDVLLTVEYTALEDRFYRDLVLKQMGIDENGYCPVGGMRFFSMHNHFPDQWYHFKNTSGANREIAIEIRKNMFPHNEDISYITFMNLIAAQDESSDVNAEITFDNTTAGMLLEEGYIQDEYDKRKFNGKSPCNTWKIKILHNTQAESLKDLILVIAYKARVHYNQ